MVGSGREQRREALLATVEHLLADRKFHELTVADVMAEAGLPRTAFYRYFPDLEAILLLGVERVSEELTGAASIWLDDATDPSGSLVPSAEALIEVYVRHGRLLTAFAEADGGAPTVAAAWHDAMDGFVTMAGGRIESLVAEGRAQLPHPRATALALIWMTERFLLEAYGRGDELSHGDGAEVLATVWRRALFSR